MGDLMTKIKTVTLVAGLALAVVACGEKKTDTTATTTTDIVCGTGPAAKEGSAVVAKYVGVNYLTGAEFDSSWKVSPHETFPFTIGQGVITGFSTGVTALRAGGRGPGSQAPWAPPRSSIGGSVKAVVGPSATSVVVLTQVLSRRVEPSASVWLRSASPK